MAWSAPRTWSTGEVVTASMMNTHVRDNLLYLKGSAGTVAIDAGMTVAGSVVATVAGNNQAILSALSGSSSVLAGIGVGRTASEVQMAIVASAAQFFAGSAAGDMVIRDIDSSKKTMIGSGTTSIITAAPGPLVGIGTASPAGALHVLGAGAISGAGFAISSVAAVVGVAQTIFAAGTVARGAVFHGVDRNNTGGNIVSLSGTILLLSGTTTYVNTDTITLAVTAGGAVTAQRTVGTNGSHDIVMLAVFL